MTPYGTADACGVDDSGCLTCGDVAVPLTVIAVLDGGDAECIDDDGRTELVATQLVGAVAAGDRVLVHARVAIALLGARADERVMTT